MKRTSPISLADFVRAVETLEIPRSDSRRSRLVARMLGMEWLEEERPAEEPPPGEPPAPAEPSPPPTPVSQREPVTDRRPPTAAEWEAPPPEARQRTLQPTRVRRREVPARLLRVPVLAEPAAEEKPPELPHVPLFRHEWARHILTGTLAIRRPEGPIDLEEVIHKVGRGEAFQTVPRLPWPSLKRRVHLLVDSGPGMEPYRKDQHRLAASFDRVVGRPRLQLFYFRGCPTRGAGIGPVYKWLPYPRPAAGTAVVLLSDLGAAPLPLGSGLFDLSEWLEFAAELSRADVPLLCLSPYPFERVDEPLRKWVTWVRWDRDTSPGRIRRQLYGGLRALRH